MFAPYFSAQLTQLFVTFTVAAADGVRDGGGGVFTEEDGAAGNRDIAADARGFGAAVKGDDAAFDGNAAATGGEPPADARAHVAAGGVETAVAGDGQGGAGRDADARAGLVPERVQSAERVSCLASAS